jgi:hypothetical protein
VFASEYDEQRFVLFSGDIQRLAVIGQPARPIQFGPCQAEHGNSDDAASNQHIQLLNRRTATYKLIVPEPDRPAQRKMASP